jgi:hypothetical protein
MLKELVLEMQQDLFSDDIKDKLSHELREIVSTNIYKDFQLDTGYRDTGIRFIGKNPQRAKAVKGKIFNALVSHLKTKLEDKGTQNITTEKLTPELTVTRTDHVFDMPKGKVRIIHRNHEGLPNDVGDLGVVFE